MLSIQRPSSSNSSTPQSLPLITPNLLPVRTVHTGAVDASPRYWNPLPASDPHSGGSGTSSVSASIATTITETEPSKTADLKDFTSTPPPQQQQQQQQQHKVAHFHGRRLLGRTVALPAGYRGVLARTTERSVGLGELQPKEAGQQQSATGNREGEERDEDEDNSYDMEGEEPDVEAQVRILDEVGGFEEIVLWGHESLPGDEDGFVRGVEEWVGFSEGVHGYDVDHAMKGV